MAEFPEKILVATDGANDSELAIRRAVDLANKTGSELHVVYVMIMSHWMLPDNLSEVQFRRLKEQAQELLEAEVGKVKEAGGEVANSYLRTGRRADEEIIDLAEEIEADMIVVGSRGAGTLTRAIMGSDAESVVRHAAVPVLVVRSVRNGQQ